MRKKNERLTRRGFLRQVAAAGAVTLGAGYLIGCKPQESGKGSSGGSPEKSAGGTKADACTDLSGLTDAEIKTRESLGYVDKTPDPAKNCANCSLYVPDQYEPAACGGCTVMKGPVMAQGYCTAWAAKAG